MAERLAVETTALVKRYGDTVAVDGVDLEVRRGSVLGLLGPNGAGKTTVVRILPTLVRQDAGAARICGYDTTKDAHRVRQLIGLTGQDASVDGDLTGAQNLQLVGRLLGLSRAQARHRAAELLDEAGLGDAAGRAAKTYSGGMRRRLDLAASLVHRPAVVFLDEPTTGLDPARRVDTWEMVRSVVAQGSTVLLTTQYLEEADQLADDVVVIDAGRVAARGTPDELKRRLGRQALDVRITDRSRLAEAAAHVAGSSARSRSSTPGATASASRCRTVGPCGGRPQPGRRRSGSQRAEPAAAQPGRRLPRPRRPPQHARAGDPGRPYARTAGRMAS
jgi:ABC-2 type transport system ATP-binding protein/oleandomycin transport system ATP-binding protein